MNLTKLNELIEKSGIKRSKICEALGISDTSLRNKLTGKTPFTWDEVLSLAKVLRMTDEECRDVFFTTKCDSTAHREAM